jgi:membrane-bound lytic murein transglycosylase D
VIRNGDIYLPYVRDEIARRNLPPELAYLPFIESGYVGTARSRSGAVGLWQFMMNSIPAGMKVDDMVDERRDFRKATAAALSKLEDNYRALGDWPLALAAYNAGLGAVRRAVQQAGTGDYWVLCDRKALKTETVHYVPKLLAVSYVLSRSRQFGIDYWPQSVAWTAIRPARQASLDLLAEEAGTDRNLLYRLNHELLHGITPPDRDYELKVPLSHAGMIAGILEREDARLLLYYRYQVRYGDTLSALSRHYGVPIDLIEQHNPGIQRRYLQIGETIVIPAYREAAPYAGSPAPVTAPQVFEGSFFEGTHVVEKGDTLWSLAARYQVDPQVLAAHNNMRFNDILSIGKVLKVPIME